LGPGKRKKRSPGVQGGKGSKNEPVFSFRSRRDAGKKVGESPSLNSEEKTSSLGNEANCATVGAKSSNGKNFQPKKREGRKGRGGKTSLNLDPRKFQGANADAFAAPRTFTEVEKQD